MWWFAGALVGLMVLMEVPWERMGSQKEGDKDAGLPGP
jgi:hypothetical protein